MLVRSVYGRVEDLYPLEAKAQFPNDIPSMFQSVFNRNSYFFQNCTNIGEEILTNQPSARDRESKKSTD